MDELLQLCSSFARDRGALARKDPLEVRLGPVVESTHQERPRTFGRPGEADLRCRQQGFRPRDWPWQPASPRRPAALGDFPSSPCTGWYTSMPNDQDLFSEEQTMVTMSFGEHIEELRVRLILALIGLFVGVIVVFIPPLDIGWRVMKKMEEPAKQALDVFYREEYDKKAKKAEVEKEKSSRASGRRRCRHVRRPSSRRIAPKLELPEGETLRGSNARTCRSSFSRPGMINAVEGSTVQIDQSLVSLAPLETLTIFFMVCLVSGLVLASPWVFYQIWSFVAAGLYRHERRYVKKYLPFSLGLFLAGVFLCFLFVLPITLTFLLQFNVWLGVAPTLAAERMDGFRHDIAADLRPLVSDAAGHAVPGADQYLHRR